jgi:hypothetical protein
MDSDQFDRLSRALAVTFTRRTSLGAALLLALAPVAETEAKRRRKKRKKKVTCPSGYTACGKQCFDLSDNIQHCGACVTVCSPGKTCCQGVCVNLQDNDSNCAACGKRCHTNDNETPREKAAEICQAGVCEPCSIEGPLKLGNPTLCCRGLKFCPGNDQGTTPSRCKPVSQAC